MIVMVYYCIVLLLFTYEYRFMAYDDNPVKCLSSFRILRFEKYAEMLVSGIDLLH